MTATLTATETRDEALRYAARADRMLADARRCGRCNGTGSLPQYRTLNGGMCFGCDGTGETRAPRAVIAETNGMYALANELLAIADAAAAAERATFRANAVAAGVDPDDFLAALLAQPTA